MCAGLRVQGRGYEEVKCTNTVEEVCTIFIILQYLYRGEQFNKSVSGGGGSILTTCIPTT